MTIYATTITTEANSAKDAWHKIKAYADLFEIAQLDQVVTYVKGTFVDSSANVVLLNSRATFTEITNRTIKYYDRSDDTWVTIKPFSDPHKGILPFELIIAK